MEKLIYLIFESMKYVKNSHMKIKASLLEKTESINDELEVIEMSKGKVNPEEMQLVLDLD